MDRREGSLTARYNRVLVLSDDDVTVLQLAVEARRESDFEALIANEPASSLTTLQLFAHHSLLMYVCEKGTPSMVKTLLERGVDLWELEWSDNNEIKSALANPDKPEEVLQLLLAHFEPEDLIDRICSDWDPEEPSTGKSQSALEIAQEKPACLALLKSKLKEWDV